MTEFRFRPKPTRPAELPAESPQEEPDMAQYRRKRLPWPLRVMRWLALSVSDLIRFLLYTLFFFALIGIFSYWCVVHYVKGNDEIAAPDLRGLTFYEAADKISPDHMSLQLDHKQPHPSMPEGRIISQIPKPDQTVKAGTPIRVIVSSGMSLVPVPNVMVGESRLAARVRLRSVGLEEGNIATIEQPGVAGGVVLATDPPPGTGVADGSRVNLLVSSGTAGALDRMPNLIGLSLDQARELLSPMRAEERTEVKPGAPADLIHTQFPAPGEQVTPQTKIIITHAPAAEANYAPRRQPPPVQMDN